MLSVVLIVTIFLLSVELVPFRSESSWLSRARDHYLILSDYGMGSLCCAAVWTMMFLYIFMFLMSSSIIIYKISMRFMLLIMVVLLVSTMCHMSTLMSLYVLDIM